MLLVLFAWAFTLVRSAPVPASADVVTVSGPGVSNHGKDNLVCFPTNLMDIAVFFFVNYLAHAASARVPAGVSTRRTIKIIIDSLCYPVLGVGYALDAIAQWTVRFKTEFPFITLPDDSLETAHRAGALITACREENWAPCPDQDRNGYLHRGVRVDSAGGKSFRVAGKHDPGQKEERKRWLRFGQPDLHFNIFGGRELPEGYGWVFIPWDVTVEPPKLNTPQIEVLVDPSPPRFGRVFTSLKLPTMPLGADYSLFQPIAAVVQAISAGITLYRTRGDQLDRYGYTAFGLTVVPYLVMSVVNFFANFAIPKYGALYIVQSDILDEATIRLGDSIPRRCVVGKLPPAEDPTKDKDKDKAPAETETEKEKEAQDPKSGTVQVVESESVPAPPTSDNKTALAPKSQETPIDDDNDEVKSETDPESVRPPNAGESEGEGESEEVVLSRFPSVKLTQQKRPLGRLTITLLHWAIGLSSFVIIAIISKLQLGTETRLIWKNFFIVWLVFSCVSAIATTAVKNIYGFVLSIIVGILRGIYHLFVEQCGDMVRKRLEKARGRTKGMAKNHKHVSSRGWSDAYHFFMFISEWVFFVLILVMVGQQLVDYGDCTYFGSKT